jgi:hypothetical protein
LKVLWATQNCLQPHTLVTVGPDARLATNTILTQDSPTWVEPALSTNA